jgi:hypothetical protein
MRLSQKLLMKMCVRSMYGAIFGFWIAAMFHTEISAWMGWGFRPTIAADFTKRVVVPFSQCNSATTQQSCETSPMNQE